MRVGIDYHPAVTHAPGVGRYARELVRALATLAPEECGGPLELALFDVGRAAPAVPERALGLEGARLPIRRLRARLPRRLLAPLAALGGPGADGLLGGVDLFHQILPNPPPVRRAPYSLALSELPPPGSPAAARLARQLARADAALVFSAHFEQLVPARFGIDPRRVQRVPVGCEHWRRELPAELPPRAAPPELLVLGALSRTRRPGLVLAAFEALARGGLEARLRFVGRPGDAAQDFARALARSPARPRVTWDPAPAEPELPALVARASVLVHLTGDEGTPVTPLEAFSCGLSVVASRAPAFEEALGEAAHFVDAEPAGAAPVAEQMAAALAAARDSEARRARERLAAGFTWRRNARATLEVWREVLERRDA